MPDEFDYNQIVSDQINGKSQPSAPPSANTYAKLAAAHRAQAGIAAKPSTAAGGRDWKPYLIAAGVGLVLAVWFWPKPKGRGRRR